MSYFYPNVRFWTTDKNGDIDRYDDICFSKIKDTEEPLVNINYVFPVTSVKCDGVELYIKFLGVFLNTKKYKYRIFSFHGKIYVFLSTNCKGWNYSKILFYMTCFRYLREFPEIVNDFLNLNKDYIKKPSLNKDILFESFQQCHLPYIINGHKLNYNNLAGHGILNTNVIFGKKIKLLPTKIPAVKISLQKNLSKCQKYIGEVLTCD